MTQATQQQFEYSTHTAEPVTSTSEVLTVGAPNVGGYQWRTTMSLSVAHTYEVTFTAHPEARQPSPGRSIGDLIDRYQQDPVRANALTEARKELAEKAYGNENSLASLRLKKGLSQKKLAELSGMRQPNIARLESGNQNPTIRTMNRLADALGVDVNEIQTIFEEMGS